MIEHEATGPEMAAPLSAPDAEGLWRLHYPALKRLAFMLSGSVAAAEDAVSAAFARSLPRLHDLDDPLAYLRRSVVNACHDDWRRTTRRKTNEARSALRDEVWMDVGHIELRDALIGLPVRQRSAVVLRHINDLDDEQVAAVMGCRPATVRSLVRHGLNRLRKELPR